MTTMLEKVAAAMKSSLPDYVGEWNDENPDPCVARYIDCGEVDFRVVARAALMAIREPSEAVVAAVEGLDVGVWEGDNVSAACSAMIDAILNETEPTP